MKTIRQQQATHSRRDILRKSGTLSLVLGFGIATVPGSVTAGRKPELVEAIASKSGLSKVDAASALDALTGATTDALANGDRVAIPEFGLFTASRRVRNTNDPDADGDSIVDFDECPELAAALDLGPGKGDQRRRAAGSKCRSADVVVDEARVAAYTRDGSHSGLSKADSKRALEGFIDAVTEALQGDNAVSVVGFGVFSISKRSARTGRNPQTGKEIQIAAKNVVKFKAGAELSKSVN
jgi:nucleoid DNA-binding protein